MLRQSLRVLVVAQILAAALLLFALVGVLAGMAPTLFGAESFAVYSGSMEPTIHVGALAVVYPVRSSDLRPGDVITYRTPVQPDVVVTHRLVAVEDTDDGKRRYRTKGDANNVEDLVLVDPNAVLGKVIYSVPYAGYVTEFSRQPLGRLLFMVIPALLLGLDFLRAQQRKRLAPATVAAPVASVAPAAADEERRLEALLDRGRQALAAGHLDLAARAADGVLASDPRSEGAWLLKVQATPEPDRQRMLLQTGLTVNPGAAALRAMLESLAAEDDRGPTENGVAYHTPHRGTNGVAAGSKGDAGGR